MKKIISFSLLLTMTYTVFATVYEEKLVASCKGSYTNVRACLFSWETDRGETGYNLYFQSDCSAHPRPQSKTFVGSEERVNNARKLKLVHRRDSLIFGSRYKFVLNKVTGEAIFQLRPGLHIDISIPIGDGPHFPGTREVEMKEDLSFEDCEIFI